MTNVSDKSISSVLWYFLIFLNFSDVETYFDTDLNQ